MPSLYDPITYGSIAAKNRVVLAPLTRARASRDSVPTAIMRTYHELRADIGLLISEATGVSREGHGWPYAPGIFTPEQVEQWKPITKAVHDKGGKIVVQLQHMGRAVHSSVTGMQPVSASPTTYPTQIHTFEGKKDPEEARALTREDIARIVGDYTRAARNSLEAGFDGVEIHAANGYLIHQFMSDVTNLRTDEYGGSIENRLRLLKQVVTAVVDVVGADRTGVRFSPNGEVQGVYDTDPEPLYVAATQFLSEKGIAFLELRESSADTSFRPTDVPQLHGPIRQHFTGKLILNQDYTRETAEKAVEDGTADAISFGRATIANPDIVTKLKEKRPLVEFNDQTKWWYSQGPEGYIDFD